MHVIDQQQMQVHALHTYNLLAAFCAADVISNRVTHPEQNDSKLCLSPLILLQPLQALKSFQFMQDKVVCSLWIRLLFLGPTILPVDLVDCRMPRLNTSPTSCPGFQQERGARALSSFHEQTGSRSLPNLDDWHLTESPFKFAHLLICTS